MLSSETILGMIEYSLINRMLNTTDIEGHGEIQIRRYGFPMSAIAGMPGCSVDLPPWGPAPNV